MKKFPFHREKFANLEGVATALQDIIPEEPATLDHQIQARDTIDSSQSLSSLMP